MKPKLAEDWHCNHTAFKFTVKIEDLLFTLDLLSLPPLILSFNVQRITQVISRQWCDLSPSVKFDVLFLEKQQIKGFNKQYLEF